MRHLRTALVISCLLFSATALAQEHELTLATGGTSQFVIVRPLALRRPRSMLLKNCKGSPGR